jgi:hypothetical protein
MDSPPLFNRMQGCRDVRFSITPVEQFKIERQYRENSNILETVFITEKGGHRSPVPSSNADSIEGAMPASAFITFVSHPGSLCGR